MTTVAERLKTLSSTSGATVAAMLLAIGSSGNTMAERLVSYSGLPTGTVIEHLLASGQSGSYVSGVLSITASTTVTQFAQGIGQTETSFSCLPAYTFTADGLGVLSSAITSISEFVGNANGILPSNCAVAGFCDLSLFSGSVFGSAGVVVGSTTCDVQHVVYSAAQALPTGTSVYSATWNATACTVSSTTCVATLDWLGDAAVVTSISIVAGADNQFAAGVLSGGEFSAYGEALPLHATLTLSGGTLATYGVSESAWRAYQDLNVWSVVYARRVGDGIVIYSEQQDTVII